MSKLIKSACLALTLVFFAFLVGNAQSSSATLTGTVEDEKGEVVPGANVTIVNDGTGARRNTTTNQSGAFTFSLLPPSTYTVTVEHTGFGSVQFPNVVLNVGDQKALQVQLKVGDVNAQIEVRPDETLINTSPAVASTIDRTFVGNLPLNGRSFQSLILLTPGVTVVPPSGSSSAGQFSVNGQRANANYFTVDGVSANTGTFSNPGASTNQTLAGATPGLTTTGGTNGLVSVDALEEFKIQTSTYSAEFGRQPGGQISLVTRSGKNQFQGSLFEYFRNEKLDANDWFANSQARDRSALRQNMFGGTFGGPVLFPSFGDDGSRWYDGKNRTFFFFSYEGLRLLLPQAITRDVPSLRLRNSVAAPTVKTLLNAFPLPTGSEIFITCTPGPAEPLCSPQTRQKPSGLAPFIGVFSDPSTADIAGVRIDHTVNNKMAVFGRYNFAVSNSAARFLQGLSQIDEREIKTQTLTLGTNWAVTTRLSNEFKINFTGDKFVATSRLDDLGGAVPIDLAATVPQGSQGNNITSSVAIALPSTLAQIVGLGSGFSNTYQRQTNIVDNVTWSRGDHTLKFGIDYRRLSPIYSPTEYSQQLQFRTEAQISNAIAGIVARTSRKGSNPIFTNLSFYGQDTWKVSQRLTVDLGLRWEINPPPGGDGKKLVTLLGADNIATATVVPAGTAIYKTDYTAFAPCVGFAFLMAERSGWERVIRGGFGVYYDVGNASAGLGLNGFPFIASGTLTNQAFPLAPTLAPPAFPTAVTSTTPLTAFAPDFRLPYTLQWNLSIEQSLGANQALSASYVAAAGRGLIALLPVNRARSGVPQPNSNFGPVNFFFNGPSSDYHSMQLQFRRRLTKGLQVLTNYTWSHAIDEVSDETSAGILERGNASFDIRHNFSAALSFNLPGRRLKGFLGSVFGNWFIDGIVHAQSASPVDLVAGSFFSDDGTQFTVRPDLVPGQPLYIDNPAVAGGRQFNSLAFAQPFVSGSTTLLRQGTFGRNVLRGLPLNQVDLGLRRQFSLTEKLHLQLKAEAFNLFNHPNFGGFSTNTAAASTFGVPTQMLGRSLGGLSPLYQIGGPRSIQLSVRLGF